MELIRDIDHSLASSYESCNRYCFWSSICGLRKKPKFKSKPGAMEYGHAFAEACDIMYQMLSLTNTQKCHLLNECYGQDIKYNPSIFHEFVQFAGKAAFSSDWPLGNDANGYSAISGYQLIESYCSYYFPEKIDIVDSEITGVVLLGKWRLRFKCDAIVQEGEAWIPMETKTSARLGDLFWTTHRRSFQTYLYAFGLEQSSGRRVPKILLNAVGTKTRTRQGNKPLNEIFIRRYMTFSKSHRDRLLSWLSEFFHDFESRQIRTIDFMQATDSDKSFSWNCLQNIRHNIKLHSMWPENARACTLYNKPCQFVDLCDTNGSIGALELYESTQWRPWMQGE